MKKTLATVAREEVTKGNLTAYAPPLFPGAMALCSVGGKKCISNMKSTLYQAVSSTALQQFLCNKYDWTTNKFHQVDWIVHQEAIEHFQIEKK